MMTRKLMITVCNWLYCSSFVAVDFCVPHVKGWMMHLARS